MAIRNLIKNGAIYFALALIASFLVFLFGASEALWIVLLLIFLQALVVELMEILEHRLRTKNINIDFAPFAAIFISYYFSFPAAMITMMVLLIIQDIDVNVNVFSEIEDVAFNVIVGVLAMMFRSADFLALAITLLVFRYFIITIVHGILTKDFNPKKYFFEGISGLIFIFFIRVIQLISG
ncbi:MAG: hypothetical protein AABX51_08465 [Nanoarchaeota archaeon]